MLKIILVFVTIIVIALIVWWFFASRQNTSTTAQVTADHQQQATITVDGGYSPSQVVFQQGIPAELTFTRKDPSSCLERVVFEKQGINKFLPRNEATTVKFDTSKAGEYPFACGMNMFHGQVLVQAQKANSAQ
ncbi:cupredoxin domain-containing protein [Lactobacillus sp. DCY120]|uniref:Cupredoxin domain-containing protein n=1 Tax=Bombilactobacillus apium TaxID=2675299 RepID=A0A850RCM5_9LACO|nr:cupredoxin domain-containing protein [Bombilactobacillus apium]NVY96518.1 cupredoxin domain-containing protein [Bombilactobacillus apium]